MEKLLVGLQISVKFRIVNANNQSRFCPHEANRWTARSVFETSTRRLHHVDLLQSSWRQADLNIPKGAARYLAPAPQRAEKDNGPGKVAGGELELLPRECIYFGPGTSPTPTILEEAVNFL
jgi:hypothetical protein